MAEQVTVSKPAPFVEKLGTNLAENVLALQGVPVVTQGLGALGAMAQPDKQDFETDEQFKTRQDLFAAQQRAALGFEQRQQALAGLAPQVAGQTALQQQAQALAEAQAGTTGIAGFQPFLTSAQQEAQLASGLGTVSLGQLGTAAATIAATTAVWSVLLGAVCGCAFKEVKGWLVSQYSPDSLWPSRLVDHGRPVSGHGLQGRRRSSSRPRWRCC